MTVLDCGHEKVGGYHIKMVNRHSTWVRTYCATCSCAITSNPHRYAHVVKWASFEERPGPDGSFRERIIFGPEWVYGPAYKRKETDTE